MRYDRYRRRSGGRAIASDDDLRQRAQGGDVPAQIAMAERHDAAGQAEEAMRWLGQAARQGNLLAMAQFGARTVIGAGAQASLPDGKALLEFAADNGGALALRYLAVLALSGLDGTPDLDRALSLAAAAANAGEERARSDLDALLGRAGNWASPADRRAVHAAAHAMAQPPAARSLCADPAIQHLAPSLSPELRDWLIAWCEPALKRAGTIDRASGEFRVEAARTNRSARIGLFDQPLELQLRKLGLARLVGEPVGNLEGTNVLAYDPGEAFAVHHDYLDPDSPGFAAELASDGQRVATVLIALNAEYDGGETAFPQIDLTWRGAPGEGLYFGNVTADGEPDPRTLHAGLPPGNGRKWILSQWIRSRAQAPG